MIKNLKIIILLATVLTIPINTTLINIKKNIKTTKSSQKKKTRTLCKETKGQGSIMEVLVVIIIIFLFFNSPVWALALFTIPVLYNGLRYMYKFGDNTGVPRNLLEKETPEFMKLDVLNPEYEERLTNLKLDVYKYLTVSKYKINKQLDQRQLAEMVKDYFKNKMKVKKNDKNGQRELKEDGLDVKSVKNGEIGKKKNGNKIEIKENTKFDMDKNIDKYSKFIFEGKIHFRQLIDEL